MGCNMPEHIHFRTYPNNLNHIKHMVTILHLIILLIAGYLLTFEIKPKKFWL